MAEEWNPVILTAIFTPNPADVGESILVQVLAADVQTVEQTDLKLTGEALTGEV